MNIIIAGCGKTGFSAARMLSDEGHNVTVIDREPQVIDNCTNDLDVIGVVGSSTDPEVLTEAGAADADLLIAMTELDEVNMVSAISAKKLGTERVIARVRDPQYLKQTDFLINALGLSGIVNPEYRCAREISRILRFPSAVRVEEFSKGKIESVEFQVNANTALCGRKLKEMSQITDAKVLIAAAVRDRTAIIPNGDFVISAGDQLTAIGTTAELRKFFIKVGYHKNPVKNVIIVGGGRLTVYLTRMLEEDRMSVTVIEKNAERCEELTGLIPEATILNGDATRSDILSEEGIDKADAFVSLTGDDDDNIMSSLFAKHCNVRKIVTKVSHNRFSEMLGGVGLDCIVTPREIIAQQLTGYARSMSSSKGGNMENLYRIGGGNVEMLEYVVGEDSHCIGVPLKDLKLKPHILISAVIRGKENIIPNGLTELLPGDHAIIVTAAGKLDALDDILAKD